MKLILFILLVNICAVLKAQTQVQNITLPNAVDGKMVSLDQYSSFSGIVVVFTSNECPFDNYYKERVKEMIHTYTGKVQFLLVNSYLEPEESSEKMHIHYSDIGVPYLADKDQLAMNSLGAKKSPEAFLLKNSANKFINLYSGAIDDNPQVPKDVSQNFLKDAIDKMLSGQKIDVTSNRAVGCSIRRK